MLHGAYLSMMAKAVDGAVQRDAMQRSHVHVSDDRV